MRLYMIRHGQSTANSERRHSGWGQFPLTEQGMEDARRTGRLLEGVAFDHVYASDLIRSQQTCALALPDAEPEINPLLREINIGVLNGVLVTECEERYGEKYIQDKAVRDFTSYGGENRDMHRGRLREFAHLLTKTPYQCVAAFAHAGSIECMAEIIENDTRKLAVGGCRNGSVSIFICEDGVWSIEAWNQTEIS